MKRKAALWAVALLLLGGAFAVVGLWRGPGLLDGAPGDRPVDLTGFVSDPDDPLRVTVFGTSLSGARYDWPDALAETLESCADRRVVLRRVTGAGASLDWAEGQIARVAETAPDLVIVEFAINNADLRDGIALAGAQARTAALVAALRDGPSEPAVVLMTMNPARGLRGIARPRLAAYYDATRAAAAQTGVGLLDMEARWRALPRAERGLDADGLHPDADRARALIVPALAGVIGGGMGRANCAAPPPA